MPVDTDKYNEISGMVEVKVNPVTEVNSVEDFINAVNNNKKHIKLVQNIRLMKIKTNEPLIYNVPNGEIDLGGKELKVLDKYFGIMGDGTIIRNGEIKTNGNSEIRFNGKNIIMEGVDMYSSVYLLGLEHDGSNFDLNKPKAVSLKIKNCHIITNNENKKYNIIKIEGLGNASVIVEKSTLETSNSYAFHILNYEGNSIIIEKDVNLKLGNETKLFMDSMEIRPVIKKN